MFDSDVPMPTNFDTVVKSARCFAENVGSKREQRIRSSGAHFRCHDTSIGRVNVAKLLLLNHVSLSLSLFRSLAASIVSRCVLLRRVVHRCLNDESNESLFALSSKGEWETSLPDGSLDDLESSNLSTPIYANIAPQVRVDADLVVFLTTLPTADAARRTRLPGHGPIAMQTIFRRRRRRVVSSAHDTSCVGQTSKARWLICRRSVSPRHRHWRRWRQGQCDRFCLFAISLQRKKYMAQDARDAEHP